MGFHLRIHDQVFGEDALLGEAVPEQVAQSPQFSAAWRFCHVWLSGQSVFELQTSGSTGTPKRMQYRREQFLASAESAGQFLHYNFGQQSLLCLNAAFVGGVMVLVRGMVHGFAVTVQEPAADTILSLPEDHTFDHVSISPIQLRQALATEADTAKLSSFKTVLVGGADLNPVLLEAAQKIKGPRIYQTFGMTETLSHFALRYLNSTEPQPYYGLLPGVEIDLSANSELIVNWPGVTEGPVHTHDLVELISPTQFIWKGRTDFTINSGGIKIQPETVEAMAKQVLATLDGRASELVLLGLANAALGQKAVPVIEGEAIPEGQIDLLKGRLKAALPKYHAPNAIYFLERFERTPTGKPSRKAIAEALKAIL